MDGNNLSSSSASVASVASSSHVTLTLNNCHHHTAEATVPIDGSAIRPSLTRQQRLFLVYQPFGLGDVYMHILHVYLSSQRARLMISLAAASLVPMTFVLMLIVHCIVNNFFRTNDTTDPKFIHKNYVGIFLILMTRLFLHQTVAVASEGAICFVAADTLLGRGRSNLFPARHVFHRLPLLMGAGVMCFIPTAVGYCFFLLAGLYVVVTLYLTVPALVLESNLEWPWDGMLSSFRLTQSRLVFYLVCHVLLLLIQSMVAHLTNRLLSWTSTGGSYGHLFSAWGTLVGMIPGLIFLPAFSIMKTVLYIRSRVEQDGLTADALARLIGLGEFLTDGGSGSYQQLAFEEEDEGSGPLIVSPLSAAVDHDSVHSSGGALAEADRGLGIHQVEESGEVALPALFDPGNGEQKAGVGFAA